MPTILRLHGWRVVIYPNDHPPAHVHVIGPGWTVVMNVMTMELREAMGCSEAVARRVVREITEHQPALLDAWRQLHG